MPVNSYASIQASIADILARTDLTAQTIDAIALFEAEAAYELFRTRGTETRTILVPSNPAALTITNAANNGSGAIRITYSGSANPALVTGNILQIATVGGTTEANGAQIITVIDPSNFDLQNSVFVNAYTSGGTAQQDLGFAALPSDYLGWSRVTFTGVPAVDLEYCAPAVWDEEYPQWVPAITTGIPRVFTAEAGFLKIKPFNPIPLEFLYWNKTAALASSLNWLASNRPDAYIAGVLEILYGLWIKDFQQAQTYKAQKMEIYQSIKMQRFREFSNLRVRIDRSSYGATP